MCVCVYVYIMYIYIYIYIHIHCSALAMQQEQLKKYVARGRFKKAINTVVAVQKMKGLKLN